MASIENDHVIDWLPDLVLDALTSEEMQQVCDHLAVCPTCQAELARFSQVADQLPLAVRQVSPPAALKGRLMQSIQEREAKPATAPGQISTWQRLTAFFRGRLPAFSLALIVILALGNLLLWSRLNQAVQQSGTPLQVITLSNSQYSPGAVGKLLLDPNGKYGTLVVDNLSVLDVSRQYQVWLIKGSYHTSGGVFSVNPDGYASLEILAPLPLQQYDAIGVSIEPAGGSDAPSGENVLHAFLAK